MTRRCNIFRPRPLAEVICNIITYHREVTDDIVRAAIIDSIVSDNVVFLTVASACKSIADFFTTLSRAESFFIPS
jgi:hypothetical protein